MRNPYLAGVDALHGFHSLGAGIYIPPRQRRAPRIGADAGVDIVQVNRTIRGIQPLRARAARKLAQIGIKLLQTANAVDSSPGATKRRLELLGELLHIDETLASGPQDLDLGDGPESAAEITRNKVLAAVAEFNAVADAQQSLAQYRAKIFPDIVSNAQAIADGVYDATKNLGSEVAWYAKATVWAVIGAVALIGYGGYKLLSSQGASNVLGAYLGRR